MGRRKKRKRIVEDLAAYGRAFTRGDVDEGDACPFCRREGDACPFCRREGAHSKSCPVGRAVALVKEAEDEAE